MEVPRCGGLVGITPERRESSDRRCGWGESLNPSVCSITPLGAINHARPQPHRPAIDDLVEHAPEWLAKITVREGTRIRRRFWQPGGGCDRDAFEIATVYAMIDYIYANLVRRGLVERPTDWEWSSARWYAGMTPVPMEMDRTLPSRLILGPDGTLGGTP